MAMLSTVYVEPGAQERIRPMRMSDEVYGAAMPNFIIDCADVFIWDPVTQKVGLAKRRAKPCPSWWVIGGRRLPGEIPPEAAVRCFERETRVCIEPSRLRLLAENEYLWKDREQEPQDVGCHAVARVFGVVLNSEEVRKIKLDPKEYDLEADLHFFGCDELSRVVDHPALRALTDLYVVARRSMP